MRYDNTFRVRATAPPARTDLVEGSAADRLVV
jgi:hypothetical protein